MQIEKINDRMHPIYRTYVFNVQHSVLEFKVHTTGSSFLSAPTNIGFVFEWHSNSVSRAFVNIVICKKIFPSTCVFFCSPNRGK